MRILGARFMANGREEKERPIEGSGELFLQFSSRRFVTPPHLLCFSRFASVSPWFFMGLFVRAFRHLTPVVSRHRRACPTAIQRTSSVCGDIKGMRKPPASPSPPRGFVPVPFLSPFFALLSIFSTTRSSSTFGQAALESRS